MVDGALGKLYNDDEVIVQQGDLGKSMFVVQNGEVEVVVDSADGEILLSVLESGDVFGEMALFTKSPRSATVRAKGEARVLTIDKRGFFKRVQEDPSLAFRILQKMSERISDLNQKVVNAGA
jgi:CRP/FNR family transcriptional regulator, cyclic AMP receptor protein